MYGNTCRDSRCVHDKIKPSEHSSSFCDQDLVSKLTGYKTTSQIFVHKIVFSYTSIVTEASLGHGHEASHAAASRPTAAPDSSSPAILVAALATALTGCAGLSSSCAALFIDGASIAMGAADEHAAVNCWMSATTGIHRSVRSSSGYNQ